jgi:hypothetical protein
MEIFSVETIEKADLYESKTRINVIMKDGRLYSIMKYDGVVCNVYGGEKGFMKMWPIRSKSEIKALTDAVTNFEKANAN